METLLLLWVIYPMAATLLLGSTFIAAMVFAPAYA